MATITPAEQARYVGGYVLTEASRAAFRDQGAPEDDIDKFASMHVSVMDGRLWLHNTARLGFPIHRERGDRFFSKSADMVLEFSGVGDDNQATDLVVRTSSPGHYERNQAAADRLERAQREKDKRRTK